MTNIRNYNKKKYFSKQLLSTLKIIREWED